MSNKTYWNDRDKARFEYIRQNLADDKAFNANLEKYYQRTIDAINKDIQSELQSFATRDGVSLAEARKKVSKADVRQFEAEAKRVVKEADKMRKKGKHVGYSDFSDEVNERMRLYNVIMRINRLEYLKSLIGVRLIELGVDINAELNTKLDEDTRKEFERQAGILAGAGMADAMDWWTEENVQKIIMSSTRSANFSTRIWSNIDVLKSELEKQLSRVLISGENPKATAKEFYKHMTKAVGNTRAAAERIARTESARCQTQATLESFKEYNVKYCRWIAEPRACVVCKEIASRSSGYGRGVYPVKDVPTLPQHPNCRCALSAHWVDEEKFASGALDGESRRGQEHARRFYNELRNSNRKDLIMKIFKSSKMSKTIVSSSLKHVLDSKYDLIYDGEIKHMNFVPDYDMAESLKRLRIGNPLKHDIIMLKHEALEADLMDNKGYTYSKAHRIANKKYNYGKALKEWKEGKA
jgi:SPP1 gp7 family putative phage head morphogenesis protein